ncbi:hypothetical protein J4225_00030 [Candidatus Pacearchaeota archaeon]|nr:hypothetical protein [Candidatus Pacearchaeota archaeon]
MRSTEYDCFECNGMGTEHNKKCPDYTPRNEEGFCVIKHIELNQEFRERNGLKSHEFDELNFLIEKEFGEKVD